MRTTAHTLTLALALAGLALAGCTDGADIGEPRERVEECSNAQPCGFSNLGLTADVVTFSNQSGRPRTQVLEISNPGPFAFRVTTLSLAGATPSAFAIRLRNDAEPAQHIETDLLLQPGDALGVELSYQGDQYGLDSALMQVVTTVFLGPLPIGLLTVNELFRLTLQPAPLDFDTIPVGSVGQATLNLVNVGEHDASVTSITASGSTEFEVAPVPLPQPLAPGQDLPIEVTYRPETPRENATGKVVVTAVDAEGSPLEVSLESELRGEAGPLLEDCMDAVALGEQVADGQGAPFEDPAGPRTELTVERGATVRLDGMASFDPDGDVIETFRWRIAEVPPDFVLEFNDDDAAQLDVELLIPGGYAFELDVFDGNDETSCQPGRVEIEVLP